MLYEIKKGEEKMIDKMHSCCFLGHRKILYNTDLKSKLYEIIQNLIEDNKVETFLFGGKSDFDKLALLVVTELQEKYPQIKRIYVRAEYQYISDDYKNYLLESYDDTYYPENIKNAGKAVYIKRNAEMIDKSSFCVIYYNENYVPAQKNIGRGFEKSSPKSGTKIAYDYALKKKTMIINLFKNKTED